MPIPFLLQVFICAAFFLGGFSCPAEAQAEKNEEVVYIPRNLEDAHNELEKILKTSDIEKMRIGTEADMSLYHHNLGRWLRNNWNLWKGGRLSKYFNEMGIHHPDDMSGIILSTFWCKLNNKPFQLQKRIEHYQEYWKVVQEPKGLSPKDGAKIAWVIGPSTEGFEAMGDQDAEGQKRMTHLGISVSDRSFWRFEYGIGIIEPAKPDEAKKLAEWWDNWQKRGGNLSGLIE